MLTMRTVFFAVLAATFCFFSCQDKPAPVAKMTGLAGGLQDSSIVRLWPSEVDSLKKSDPNIPIVDVRSETEFMESHIYRSINCDVDSPDFAQRIVKLGREYPVILYDVDSSRSLKAAEIMKQLGFKRTYEIAGGIFSWAREGKTLVSGPSKIDSSTVLR